MSLQTTIYNPDQCPPDWDLASKHGYASLVGKSIPNSNQVCPCCINLLNKSPISLGQDNKQLAFLGEGFPLFYNFCKFSMIMLGSLVLDSSVVNLLLNLNENSCNSQMHTSHEQIVEQCYMSFQIKTSYSHHIPLDANSNIRFTLRIISFIGQLLLLLYFREQQQSLAQYLDQRNCTMSDYSIILQNIPKGVKDNKSKIKKFIEKFDKDFRVMDILLVEDTRQYLQKQENIKQIKKEILRSKLNKQSNQIIKNLQKQCEIMEIGLRKFGKQMKNNQQKYFIGCSFVILNTQTQVFKAIQKINNAQITDIEAQFPNFNPLIHRMITAEQAKQPRQIIWQNIHYTQYQRCLAIFFGWFTTVIFIGIVTIVFFYLSEQKTKIVQQGIQHKIIDGKKVHEYNKSFELGNNLGYILVFIINIFNKFCLAPIVHIITDHERHKDYSRQTSSFAIKYTLGMFFTTALMTIAVQAIINKNFFQQLGVVQEQFFMFFFNALFPPLIWLINPQYLYRQIKKRIYFKSDSMTQQEANQLMQFPDYNMGKRYAEIMKTLWFTFLYAELLPIGSIISLIGVIAYYYVDKYVLLRKSAVKENISSQLSKTMIKMIQFTLVLKSGGQIFFDVYARDVMDMATISSMVMACIGAIIILLPMQKIFARIFTQQLKLQQKTYEQTRKTFKQTYFTNYPIRKEQLKKILYQNSIKVLKQQVTINQNEVQENSQPETVRNLNTDLIKINQTIQKKNDK